MNCYYIDEFIKQYVALLIPLSGTHLKNMLVFVQINAHLDYATIVCNNLPN